MSIWRDLRYLLRTLLRSPGIPAIIVLTLAVGIGANSAIFSVVKAVLLRPLPFKDPDRLVLIWREHPYQGTTLEMFSGPDFIDVRGQNDVFEDMAATLVATFTLTGQGEPEQVYGAYVSQNFYSLLGTEAGLGRTFSAENTTANSNVVVVSDGLWQRRFGSDPSLIGKSLTLSGKSYLVVGIAPRDFQFPPSFDEQGGLIPWTLDAWVPLDLHARNVEGLDLTDRDPENGFLQVLARLKPGVSLGQAQANLETINQRLARQYPVTNKRLGVRVILLMEQLVHDVRRGLLVLLMAVVFVLLIACANVANLLLARGAARQKDIAICMALGASRSRLSWQFLVESVLLALLGGILGLVLANWGNHLLVAISPETLPRVKDTRLDLWVLGFTLVVALLTGVLFGMAPVFHLKPDLNGELKESGRGATSGLHRQSLRNSLVISEIALAFVLLTGAGLMIKSFLGLQAVNPGFATHNILTVKIKPSRGNYRDQQQRATLFRRVVQRVTTVPGVESAGAINILPLTEGSAYLPVEIEGGPEVPAGERRFAGYHSVSPTYFRTMGIPLMRGRYFNEADAEDRPRVAIIGEAMARRFFLHENPIGKRISVTSPPAQAVWLEIIGVVGDAKYEHVDQVIAPDIYVSYLQPYPYIPNNRMALVIRTTLEQASMVAAIRREVQAIDKDQPIYDIKSMGEYFAESIAKPRLYAFILSLFAATAFLLSVAGIYGVMSYTVSQRVNEIGIRMAVGGEPADIIRLVLVQGMVLVGIGLAIGISSALALTRLMVGLLYDVKATDPLIFVALSLFLATVAVAASCVPARRATKIDPIGVLRNISN